MTPRSRREADRRRRKRRLRRLIAVVVLVDLVGAGCVAFALSRGRDAPTQASRDRAGLALRPSHPQWTITYANGEVQTGPQTSVSNSPAAQTQTQTRPTRVTPTRRRTAHVSSTRAVTTTLGNASASFASFAASQPGQVGLAIAPLGSGPVETYGPLQIGHAWSTMKVPVLVTLLSQVAASGGQLDSSEQDDATLALTESDNAAAEALFSQIEDADGGLTAASLAVQNTLRKAGDDTTIINTAPNDQGFTTWGQSEWSASGEVAFYRSLANACLLSSADTAYVLNLMSQVEPGQRWGAGAAAWGSAPLMFKGGWGPDLETGQYLTRQSVIVGSGSSGYVFDMIAQASDGEFGTETNMLSQLATWVARSFPVDVDSAPARCA